MTSGCFACKRMNTSVLFVGFQILHTSALYFGLKRFIVNIKMKFFFFIYKFYFVYWTYFKRSKIMSLCYIIHVNFHYVYKKV